jgi:hypothetical protein
MKDNEIYIVFVKPGGKLIRKKQRDLLGPGKISFFNILRWYFAVYGYINEH